MNKNIDKLSELKLTKRQKLFCLFYLRDFDAKKAALSAGLCKKEKAEYVGTSLLLQENIKKALAYYKEEAGERLCVELSDVMDIYTRIAFADNGKCIKWYKNDKDEWVSDIDFDEVDGQLIDEITASKAGVKIKFLDKFKALERLEKSMGEAQEQTEEDGNNKITVITAALRPTKTEDE